MEAGLIERADADIYEKPYDKPKIYAYKKTFSISLNPLHLTSKKRRVNEI